MRPLARTLIRSSARSVAVLLLACGMVLVSPSVSLACSCAQLTPEQQTENAETVAVGIVTSMSSDSIETSYRVSFDEVYKGIAGRAEKVITPADEASCGLGELTTGESYVFFIDGKHPGHGDPR